MAQARHALKQAEARACCAFHQAKETYHIALLTGLYDGFHSTGSREVFNVISQICGSNFSRKGIKILADEKTATFGKNSALPQSPSGKYQPPLTFAAQNTSLGEWGSSALQHQLEVLSGP